MDKEEIAPHVDDIARVLGDKLSREEIEKEIENYVEVYRVPLGTAKRSIVKKYGGNSMDLSVGVSVPINELKPNVSSVDILCRIVAVNPKEIGQEGDRRTIFYGILGDQTGTVPFTSWEPEFKFEKGDVVRIKNAYTKEWQGQVQVNFGNRTTLAAEDADALPKFEGSRGPGRHFAIKDLREGLSGARIKGRILSVEDKQVTARGEEKTIYSGVIADESGKVQFSSWHDFELKVGSVIDIESGYVRAWRGIPQFNFDQNSKVTFMDDDAVPGAEELESSMKLSIREIEEQGGALDTSVRGIIVDVKPGSGLIQRCPECKRVVQKGTCRVHGSVKGNPDLRVKAILDDGEGALTLIINRELTERLLGKSMDDFAAIAKEAMDTEPVRVMIQDALLAMPFVARGNVTNDEFGLMMIANETRLVAPDARREAQSLLESLEGGL